MSKVPAQDVPTVKVSDMGCYNRFLVNTTAGLVGGLAVVVGMVCFKAPSLTAKNNVGRVFRNLCVEVLPYTTGGAALYTGVSCSIEANSTKKDWVAPFVGGFTTGAFIYGVKLRSVPGAVIGGALGGLAATMPIISSALGSTNAEDLQFAREKQVILPPSAQSYATNASDSAAGKLL